MRNSKRHYDDKTTHTTTNDNNNNNGSDDLVQKQKQLRKHDAGTNARHKQQRRRRQEEEDEVIEGNEDELEGNDAKQGCPSNSVESGSDTTTASKSVAQQIPIVNTSSLSAKTFFHDYVASRQPCILVPPKQQEQPQEHQQGFDVCLPSGDHLQLKVLIAAMRRLAGTKQVQVEKRSSTTEAFGQNRTKARQLEMTLDEFLNIMSSSSSSSSDATMDAELLYLSTQQPPSPPPSKPQEDNEHFCNGGGAGENNQDQQMDASIRLEDPFTTPCQELVDANIIPRHLDWAGNLMLHQCNVWIGQSKNDSSSSSSSSGLHHDFHDNFYLLLQGRKRFRLFAPNDAPCMYTYGPLERIHPNGVCSYVGHELRADGVPLAVLASIQATKKVNDDDDNDSDVEDGEGGADDDDESEVVIGKGFDYQSSGSEEDETSEQNLENDGVDDYDELIMEESEQQEHFNNDVTEKVENDAAEPRPKHFSRIDPKLLLPANRSVLAKEFPLLVQCQEYLVELQAGQILYLPASWFHEVTSMSGTTTSNSSSSNSLTKQNGWCSSSNHVALNYWYYPPDALDNFEHPYQDDFWKRMTTTTTATKETPS